jgi:hypothetical protein
MSGYIGSKTSVTLVDGYTQAEADAEFVQDPEGSNTDALTDLGATNNRFKDLYLSGGVYLGGTGSANKLDDYEEGTWTPNIIRFDGTVPATYTTGPSTYVKVGRLVTITTFVYNLSNGSSNGSSYWTIKGVPFLGDQYYAVMLSYNSTGANNAYIGDAGGQIILATNNVVYSGSLTTMSFMLTLTYETSA